MELLKAGGMNPVKWMQRVFNLIVKSDKSSKYWQRAVVIPVYKKRCRMTCGNYRGVSLLRVTVKWFGKELIGCDIAQGSYNMKPPLWVKGVDNH